MERSGLSRSRKRDAGSTWSLIWAFMEGFLEVVSRCSLGRANQPERVAGALGEGLEGSESEAAVPSAISGVRQWAAARETSIPVAGGHRWGAGRAEDSERGRRYPPKGLGSGHHWVGLGSEEQRRGRFGELSLGCQGQGGKVGSGVAQELGVPGMAQTKASEGAGRG